MKKVSKKIVYITTNGSWSGSEELWTRSAKKMIDLGHNVTIVSAFHHPAISGIAAKTMVLEDSSTFSNKILSKLKLVNRSERTDILQKYFTNHKADLAIISQGNNIDSLDVMFICQKFKVAYITITQLVTEAHLLFINNDNLKSYQNAYLKAVKNFFVSKRNLALNNVMFGVNLPNAALVYNPCKLTEKDVPMYPSKSDNYYVGLVGRIECFHKGYDLLITVLSCEKWRSRNLHFNIYGDGPHTGLLKDSIRLNTLSNVHLKGYSRNVADVWKDNQILCLPSRMEGQALSLIEAMFCNRAAIVTDVGGAGELIEDEYSGFIAEFASVNSLDAALERAWQKRESWEEMGRSAGAAIRKLYPADAVDFFNEKILKELEIL